MLFRSNISTWHYDSLGRVTRAVCDGKSYEYIYDAYGNLKEKRSNGKRLVSYESADTADSILDTEEPAVEPDVPVVEEAAAPAPTPSPPSASPAPSAARPPSLLSATGMMSRLPKTVMM